MLRILKPILAIGLLISYILVFNNSHTLSPKLSIPALGKFFHPWSGFWQNATPIEQNNVIDKTTIPSLQDQVTILYDERQVPHIYAKNDLDAYRVQGYLLASQRLWQMDIAVRSISGRLSEVFGLKAIEVDKLRRRQGFRYTAERDWELWKKDSAALNIFESFSEGINAYIQQLTPAQYPIEFKLFGYAPEIWKPVNSIYFIKSMCRTLAFMNDDVQNTYAREKLGSMLFDRMYPELNPDDIPVIPEFHIKPPGISQIKMAHDTNLYFSNLELSPPEKTSGELGSNNWVVGPARTNSGYPILCNDPHLSLTLPSVWYESQITTPNQCVYGVTFPGVPGVVIGFNEHIAWGVTNVGQDVLDWYHIQWVDSTRKEYWLDGKKEKTQILEEMILVKDAPPVKDQVFVTCWGPVVYPDSTAPVRNLAMRWVCNEPALGQEALTFLKINKAKNYSEFKDAIQNYAYPAQNFVFASRDKEIAIHIQGKFPKRVPQQGRFIQRGDLSTSQWAGWIPKEHLASSLNPKKGFVCSANQQSYPKDYPYYFLGDFYDFRGRYLNERLDTMKGIEVQDMMRLQNDVTSLRTLEALPVMLRLCNAQPNNLLFTSCLQLLQAWNMKHTASSQAPPLFESWFQVLHRLTFDEVTQRNDSLSFLKPEDWFLIHLLKDSPNDPIFDIQETVQKETAKEICTQAFIKVIEEFSQYQEVKGLPTWSAFRHFSINHLVSQLTGFGRLNLPAPGVSSALNATGKNGVGPSWRMIVELGPQLKAYGVFPGGNSGNPGDPNYDHMVDTWVNGEYFTLNFWPDIKKAESLSKMKSTLTPQ